MKFLVLMMMMLSLTVNAKIQSYSLICEINFAGEVDEDSIEYEFAVRDGDIFMLRERTWHSCAFESFYEPTMFTYICGDESVVFTAHMHQMFFKGMEYKCVTKRSRY